MMELMFAWLAVVVAIGALFAALGARGEWVPRILWAAAGAGLCACVLRGLATGHLPKFGTFEESVAAATVIWLHAAIVAGRRERATAAAVAGSVGVCVLLHGLAFPLQRYPLTISEQSIWLDLHVVAAWTTWAAIAMTIGGAYWLLRRGGAAAEGLTVRSLQFGFLLQSVLMLGGAWYSYRLFGKAFSFDPIEILAVMAWLVVAAVLHLRAYRGLRGRALAVLSLVAAAVLVLSFRLILYLGPASTYHIIDLELKLHG